MRLRGTIRTKGILDLGRIIGEAAAAQLLGHGPGANADVTDIRTMRRMLVVVGVDDTAVLMPLRTDGTWWGTSEETYYKAPSGKVWCVQSPDLIDDRPLLVHEVPPKAERLSPQSCADIHLPLDSKHEVRT